MSSRGHFLEPLLKAGATGHALRIDRTGRVVARHLEVAADSKTRTRGLLGRTGLDEDTTLIIAPCNAVHTFFMRFTIDVVFADRQGRVLKLCRCLPPWRIGFAIHAFAALELAAGSIDRAGIVTGDRLSVVPR